MLAHVMFSTWPYILILRLIFIFKNNKGISCSICIRKLQQKTVHLDGSVFRRLLLWLLPFFFIYVSMCRVFFFHNQTVSVAFVPFLFRVTLKSSDIPLWKGRCTPVPSLIKRSWRKSANRWTYRIFPRALFFLLLLLCTFFLLSLIWGHTTLKVRVPENI